MEEQKALDVDTLDRHIGLATDILIARIDILQQTITRAFGNLLILAVFGLAAYHLINAVLAARES